MQKMERLQSRTGKDRYKLAFVNIKYVTCDESRSVGEYHPVCADCLRICGLTDFEQKHY